MTEAGHRIVYMAETSSKGGSESALASLAVGMQERGFRVGAILSEAGWLSEELGAHDISVAFVRLAPAARLPNIFVVALRVARALREQNACCVHTFSFQSQFYGCLAASLTRVPCVVGLRSTYYDFAARRRVLAWNWIMGRLASRIVCVSEGTRRKLLESTRVAPAKVLAVPNGVDLQRFRCLRDRSHMRRSLGLPLDGLVVGTVGRHYPVKGYRDLLIAAREVVRRVPSAHFAIVASHRDPGYESTYRLRDQLGLRGKLTLVDKRADIPDVLGAFDVFAHSSLSEGMSNALLEALAAGCPVVATAVGGTPEVIGDGASAAGVLVPPADPRAMTEAIVGLLLDPARRETLATVGSMRVRALFTREMMLDRYEAIYRRILPDRRGGRSACV